MSEEKVAEKVHEKAPPRVVKPLNERQFHQEHVKSNTWEVIAESGTLPEDLLDIGYWANVAGNSLRPFDKIKAMEETKAWYAEYVVFATYGQGAAVRLLHKIIITEKSALPPIDLEYEVFDGGLAKEWCVRRIKDGRTLKANERSKQEAEKWLLDWLKAQGKKAA